MFGLNIAFKCRECAADNTSDVSICELYTVNDKAYEYVEVECKQCNKAYYAATQGIPIKEMTLEAKKEALYRRGGEKSSERAQQDWLEHAPFILESDYLVFKDVETVAVRTGIACF